MADYTRQFVKPYEDGWENLPSESTPIRADILNDYDSTFESIEDYLEDNPIITVDVVDNLTSEDTDKALSANQGKVLKDSLDVQMESLTHQTELGFLGKNIFDKSDIYDANCYYDTTNVRTARNPWDAYFCKVKSGATYVISGVSTTSANASINAYNEDGFVASLETYQNTTFTVPSGITKILVSVRKVDKDVFQIEEGSEATSYSEYALGNTELTKQMESATNEGFISRNLLPSEVNKIVPCKLRVGDVVTWSAKISSGSLTLKQYNADKTVADYWMLGQSTNPRTFTITADSEYIALTDNNANVTNIMLNRGTEVLPYEPYAPSNTSLMESLSPQAYSTSGLTYNNCSYLSGGYVKIGNLVVVNLRISSDGSSTLQINNLPSYTNKSSLNCVAVSIFDTVDHNNQVFGYMASGGVLRAENVSGAHAHLISVVYLCD